MQQIVALISIFDLWIDFGKAKIVHSYSIQVLAEVNWISVVILQFIYHY